MKRLLFLVFFVVGTGVLSYSQEEMRLLRFPAIYGNQIVFSYAGDLYTVDAAGGLARRLTNNVGYEMFARFSPDGKEIAFTGQYDGNTEVFTIPSEGGVPKRITYTATLSRDDVADRMGPNNIVMGWTPDGKQIIFRSRKQSFNSFIGQLFDVSVDGGISTEVPLATGGFCSYSPDGSKLAFNRIFREFRTWKRYMGGMADDIWIYDFKTKTTSKITDDPHQDIIPMWHGDDIYFLSDRTQTMNLFVYNTKTKQTTQLTDFTDYDIKFPSIGKNAIVFENAGYIYRFDLTTKKYNIVHVEIANDQEFSRSSWEDASKLIRDGDVSPHGERAVLSARGDIFTLPAKKGITKNLTQTSGVHERNATWSPDGKYIAYISDKTGEFEIYIQVQDGSQPAVQLTTNADSYKYGMVWSPDSKKLLWSDNKLRLRMMDVQNKQVTEVATCKYGEFGDYNFSPDSKWITYDAPIANQFEMVFLYNIASGKTTSVTNDWFSADSPTFSDDGKYLFFNSDRDFNPIYSYVEWNYAYNNLGGIYLVTLAKDTPSPFAPENDTVKVTEEKPPVANTGDKKKSKTKEEEKSTEGVTVNIDTTGLRDRIIAVPVEPGNYGNITCIGNSVYYNDYNAKTSEYHLKVYDLKDKKETDLGENLRYAVSADKKKMLVAKGSDMAIIDLPKSKVDMSEKLDLSHMKVFVDFHKEWKQIFDESWRQMRDFFYMPTMHGLNWKAVHDKYAVLVPYVNQRDDLTYLIGEMIGELSIGHAYVESGNKPKAERIQTGLLGAQLSRDASGYYKVDHILKGANWSKELRSPFTEIGVNVKEGDFILAVDGNSTKDMNNIYESLVGKANIEVELTVNDKPSMVGSRKVIVVPLADESSLYYYQWVEGNIKKVSDATNGQVGYIHIPDMGPEGLNEFVKHFYPQLDKKALIIDDRGNGGGNVSPMIIERLRRVVTHANMRRNVPVPYYTPNQMMLGPKVLLINYASASDGDLFAYSFKKHKIGTVIGTRTWGGVVGIRGTLPFVDGADLRKPEFASYSSDSSAWIIEGHGVEPDITVVNDPAKEFAGDDQQLNKAIEVIKDQLKNYKPMPPIPAPPDKSKKPVQ